MAARRLIAVLLVLLFLSSLAAALAPVPEREGSQTTSTSTSTSPSPPAVVEGESEARRVEQSVDASAEKPVVIRIRAGDQLQLRVTSSETGTVELSGLGPTEDVGPRQPAFFDVLIDAEGDYPVRFLESGEEFATIRVSPPDAESPG